MFCRSVVFVVAIDVVADDPLFKLREMQTCVCSLDSRAIELSTFVLFPFIVRCCVCFCSDGDEAVTACVRPNVHCIRLFFRNSRRRSSTSAGDDF